MRWTKEKMFDIMTWKNISAWTETLFKIMRWKYDNLCLPIKHKMMTADGLSERTRNFISLTTGKQARKYLKSKAMFFSDECWKFHGQSTKSNLHVFNGPKTIIYCKEKEAVNIADHIMRRLWCKHQNEAVNYVGHMRRLWCKHQKETVNNVGHILRRLWCKHQKETVNIVGYIIKRLWCKHQKEVVNNVGHIMRE